MKSTAVATLVHKSESQMGGQTILTFCADYKDERNKEWSKYTPILNLQMHVTDAVAEQYDLRGRYLLTFERAE